MSSLGMVANAGEGSLMESSLMRKFSHISGSPVCASHLKIAQVHSQRAMTVEYRSELQCLCRRHAAEGGAAAAGRQRRQWLFWTHQAAIVRSAWQAKHLLMSGMKLRLLH